MTERQILERLKKLRTKSNKTDIMSLKQQKTIKELKMRWMTYFRNNIEIYINYRMGFHGYGYQNFSYHLMNVSDQYVEISTRGVGKSLRVVAYGAARALLYPNSKIGLAAKDNSQSSEDYLTAFMQELIQKQLSPLLHWLYVHKLITGRETDKGYVVNFWNGSVIYFFPTINSSRGIHVDTLIGEEIRLIKKADWDSIAMPMLIKRQGGFRNQPEYYERTDLDERTKVICISSSWFANNWMNTFYRNTVVGYFKEVFVKNRVFSVDIFSAIKHGLKDEQWYLKQRKEMDNLSFRIEILNETVGEVEGAYFTLEMMTKNQLLTQPFYPVTNSQYINGTQIPFRDKYEDEIRLLFIDFAFAGGDKNDNTCIGCMSAYPKGERWVRHVDFIQTLSGASTDEALLSIREIYQDYGANYIVYDNRNGGTLNYNTLSKEFEHPVRKSDDWNKHGFTVCNEMDLHVVSKQVYDDLVNRTNDQNAIPCLIPISASAEFNSVMWQNLNKSFRDDELLLLIDKLNYEQNNIEKSVNLSSEEKAYNESPYIETDMLINEAINLVATYKANGLVSLSEGTNPNNTKDRIVSLGYGNYIMTKIINKKEKEMSEASEIDWENFKLVY